MSYIPRLYLQLKALVSGWSSPLGLIAILVIAQLLHGTVDLAYVRDDVTNGAVWRLLSGQLVHHNTAHLLLNIAGLLLVWLVRDGECRGLHFIQLSLSVAMVTGCLLYLFEPRLHYYLGFSGALHGIAIVIAARLLARGLGTGLLLGAALLIKLVWEQLSVDASSGTAALINIRVATEAHVWGAIGGLAVASLSVAHALYVRMTRSTKAP